MLRYYTYYSVGGYKDLYLGNSTMDVEYTYYLPLLAIKKKEAIGNEEATKMVQHLEDLPQIKLVNKSNTYGLPMYAAHLISHGGYKLIYTHVENDLYILSLRDIQGENKDESGRSIPFLIMIVADNILDAKKLATIAAYWSNNLTTISSKLASILTYDSEVNGIKFHLKEFNCLLAECTHKQKSIETTNNNIVVTSRGNCVGALLASTNISQKFLMNELNLTSKYVNYIPIDEVLPNDNPQQKKRMLQAAQRAKKRKKHIFYFAIGCTLLLILLLLLV